MSGVVAYVKAALGDRKDWLGRHLYNDNVVPVVKHVGPSRHEPLLRCALIKDFARQGILDRTAMMKAGFDPAEHTRALLFEMEKSYEGEARGKFYATCGVSMVLVRAFEVAEAIKFCYHNRADHGGNLAALEAEYAPLVVALRKEHAKRLQEWNLPVEALEMRTWMK